MKVRVIVGSVVIIAALATVVGGLMILKSRSNAKQAAMAAMMPEPTETVKAALAVEQPFQIVIGAVGTVVAKRHVILSNEIAGSITEVLFDSGQIVQAGQVLVRLDASVDKAELGALMADLKLATATFSRLSEAVKSGAASAQDIDSARANLERATAKIAELESRIAKRTLSAPFAARTGLRNVHPGGFLAEGAQIVALQGLDDYVYVDFSLPQLQAAFLGVGSVVKLKPSTLVIGEGIEADVPATVRAMDATVDLATRNMRIRAEAPNAADVLKPGMFIEVRVPMGPARKVVTLPVTAIRKAPFGDQIFIIEPDAKDPKQMRARQRFVKVGANMGESVIIESGVKVGETVATDGSFKLREGVLVYAQLSEPTKAGAAADAAATAGKN